LTPDTTEPEIRERFTEFGPIEDIKMQTDKGYSFVRYQDHVSAANAILKGTGKVIRGRQIKCSWGREKDPSHGAAHGMPPMMPYAHGMPPMMPYAPYYPGSHSQPPTAGAAGAHAAHAAHGGYYPYTPGATPYSYGAGYPGYPAYPSAEQGSQGASAYPKR